MKKNRNIFHCPFCGYGVYTESRDKNCARCDTTMDFVMKESEEKIKTK